MISTHLAYYNTNSALVRKLGSDMSGSLYHTEILRALRAMSNLNSALPAYEQFSMEHPTPDSMEYMLCKNLISHERPDSTTFRPLNPVRSWYKGGCALKLINRLFTPQSVKYEWTIVSQHLAALSQEELCYTFAELWLEQELVNAGNIVTRLRKSLPELKAMLE